MLFAAFCFSVSGACTRVLGKHISSVELVFFRNIIAIDSGSVDEVVEDIIIRDRRHLSEDGFVLPIVAIDKNSGVIEGQPEIVSRGFVSFDEGDLMESARQIVVKTLENSNAEERSDWGVIQEKIRVDLKRFLTKQTSRRPLIVPVILEV